MPAKSINSDTDGREKINICSNCQEGCIFDEIVYCNIDGRFQSQHSGLMCKNFVLKQE